MDIPIDAEVVAVLDGQPAQWRTASDLYLLSPDGLILTRPLTESEVAAVEAEQVALVAEQTASAVTFDTAADLPRLREALDGPIATLLGDNTVAGSIRAWINPITNNQTLTGSEGKALARLLIDVTQQVRLVARQTLRVAAQTVGDYSSADLPDEPSA